MVGLISLAVWQALRRSGYRRSRCILTQSELALPQQLLPQQLLHGPLIHRFLDMTRAWQTISVSNQPQMANRLSSNLHFMHHSLHRCQRFLEALIHPARQPHLQHPQPNQVRFHRVVVYQRLAEVAAALVTHHRVGHLEYRVHRSP